MSGEKCVEREIVLGTYAQLHVPDLLGQRYRRLIVGDETRQIPIVRAQHGARVVERDRFLRGAMPEQGLRSIEFTPDLDVPAGQLVKLREPHVHMKPFARGPQRHGRGERSLRLGESCRRIAVKPAQP